MNPHACMQVDRAYANLGEVYTEGTDEGDLNKIHMRQTAKFSTILSLQLYFPPSLECRRSLYGYHTIYCKNTFIAILVPNLSFVVFIICPIYCYLCCIYQFLYNIYQYLSIYRFLGCIYSCTCPVYRFVND